MTPPPRVRISSLTAPPRRCSPLLSWALVVLAITLTSHVGRAAAPATAPAQPPPRVLLLYSDERLLPANIAIDEAIRATFAATTNRPVEFYTEFFDRPRFAGQAQEQYQRDFLRNKYRERSPHIVIAVSGAALAFSLKYRAEAFAGAPIVYCSAPGDSPPPELRDAVVGQVSLPNAAGPTLNLALRLHPDTRLVAVVCGTSARDVQLAEGLRSDIPAFEKRVAFTWLTNRSLPELRADLSRLPDHSIVLYHTMFQDARWQNLPPAPGAGRVRARQPLPNLRLLRYLPGIRDRRRLHGDL